MSYDPRRIFEGHIADRPGTPPLHRRPTDHQSTASVPGHHVAEQGLERFAARVKAREGVLHLFAGLDVVDPFDIQFAELTTYLPFALSWASRWG
jgi:hypothetical protein